MGDLQEASWVRHAWAPAPALRFAAPTLVTRCEHVMNARLRADVLKIRRVRLKTSDFFFHGRCSFPHPRWGSRGIRGRRKHPSLGSWVARGRGRALTLIKRQLFARRARGLSRTLGSLTSPGKESDGGSSHKTGTRDTRLDIAGLLRADHAAGMMRALQVSPRQRDSSHLCGTEPLLPPCPGGGGDRVLERGLAHWGRAQCWGRGTHAPIQQADRFASSLPAHFFEKPSLQPDHSWKIFLSLFSLLIVGS